MNVRAHFSQVLQIQIRDAAFCKILKRVFWVKPLLTQLGTHIFPSPGILIPNLVTRKDTSRQFVDDWNSIAEMSTRINHIITKYRFTKPHTNNINITLDNELVPLSIVINYTAFPLRKTPTLWNPPSLCRIAGRSHIPVACHTAPLS